MNVPAKNIAVVELKEGGHHPDVLPAIIQALKMADVKIWLFLKNSIFQKLHRHLKEIRPLLNGLIILEPFPNYKNFRNQKISWSVYNYRTFSAIERVLRKTERDEGFKFDQVVFPAIYDDSFYRFGLSRWRFNRKLSGIYMNSRYFRLGSEAYRRSCISAEPLFLKDIRIETIYVLDAGIEQAVRNYTGKSNVVFLPEPVEKIQTQPHGPVVKALRNMADLPIVSLLGFLKRGKGVMDFIELSKRFRGECIFLLAGHLYAVEFSQKEIEAIDELSANADSNFIFISGRIDSEQEFHWLVERSDVLYLLYKDFSSSSNQLGMSVIYGKLSMVPSSGWMGEVAERCPSAVTVSPNNVDEAEKVLRTLLPRIKDRLDDGEKRLSDFSDLFSRQRFIERLAGSFK